MKRWILCWMAGLLLIPLASAQSQDKINKKNLVVKEWNTDARSNKKALDHLTTFDAQGRKIEEIEYNASGQKWRKRYEWGQNGKCSRESLYDERNHLVNYKTFEYNEYGRKKVQYTYDAKGKLVTIKNYEYILSDE